MRIAMEMKIASMNGDTAMFPFHSSSAKFTCGVSPSMTLKVIHISATPPAA
jgi:hypothetical protein